MTEYIDIKLHRGVVIPGGGDIQLLPEFLYTFEVSGIKYNIGIEFNPTPNNKIFTANVNSWHTGIGSSPSMGKIGEAYFPESLKSNQPGIIIVKNIISSTQERTFQRNQDLITCLLKHHRDFLEKNIGLVKKLEKIDTDSVLIGKIL